MSRIADKMIQIEKLIASGYSVKVTSEIANVPVSWVNIVERELFGMYPQPSKREDMSQSYYDPRKEMV
jgi:hypothetical protein